MGILSIMSNSFGCSASGERLVSAARDGDLQEAKALLQYNPRLARYSTFGVRNSPLHFSAAQGHHEIVSLLLESGVDINLRNFRGETALMQACQYGHWEVVQTLIFFKANIHKMDYINGGTALHFAALNGHARCIRLLLADYVPSIPNFLSQRSNQQISTFHALSRVVNIKADGGITALHMAALNAHVECVQLLLDLGAHVSEVTLDDGTTIDLIGPGSTPLHYAACGGNAVCCQMLIAKGASLTAQNANGWTPLMVAQSWRRNWLEGILTIQTETRTRTNSLSLPSPYLSLPLMSIMSIARELGWRNRDDLPPCVDPCAVCLERSCTVAAEGCNHEFCTRCALYLSTTVSSTLLGSIPCPLCRHGIVSFARLPPSTPHPSPPLSFPRLSLSLCATCPSVATDSDSFPNFKPATSSSDSSDLQCTWVPPIGTCQRFTSVKLNPVLCMGNPETSPCLIRCARTGSGLRRSVSHGENSARSWVFGLNQGVAGATSTRT